MINFKQLKKVLDQGKKVPDDQKKYKDLSPIEKLFRKTKVLIYQENHNIGIEPKYPLTCDPERAHLFYARHYGLMSFCHEMHENFKKLEKDYDTLELQQHLAYTEQYLAYTRTMSFICKELVDYKEALDENKHYVSELGKQLQSAHDAEAVQVVEEALEQVLDTADLLSDQYEDFSTREIDVSSLEPFYEGYKQQIELLQEDFEEAQDWVN